MKKFFGLILGAIALITLSGCKKDISSKELINKWETTVNRTSDILIEQRDLDLNDKKNVSSFVNKIDKEKKSIKNDSKTLNDSKAIETAKGKELNKIYTLTLSTLDVIKKESKKQPISDKESEAPGLLGKRTSEFANEYNKGKLPDSLEMFMSLQNKDEEEYEDLKDKNDKLGEDLEKAHENTLDSLKKVQEAFR